MTRRLSRTLWPLLLLLLLIGWRAVGCRTKKADPGARSAAPAHWITPRMTMPPPRPTVTMWKGVTRVPQLPE